jgi:two-component system, chemotaxis family, protein-glutamate methylesterase/glutaminase
MSAIVVVGASLGGLSAIRTVLSGLPADFPAPIAIVQHRQNEGGTRLLDLLQTVCALEVREPDDGEPIMDGTVFLAPAGYHLMVDKTFFSLSTDEPVAFARPSIDVLFETAAENHGEDVASVLLSASNQDGAHGSAAVCTAGGTTILQDPTTAESNIALLAAIALHKPTHIAPLPEIPNILCAWSKARKQGPAGGSK